MCVLGVFCILLSFPLPITFEQVQKFYNERHAQEWHSLFQHQKRTAFASALAKQTSVMLENVSGFGIDNHLTALRILAVEHAEEKKENAEYWTDLQLVSFLH